ncbi:MAG: M50 family metallopeptidase [Phycisphaerae bacterium]|nr:M50 family metallopeptidase [Phycisphaerae bacterium]
MHPRLIIGVFVLCGVVLSGTAHELGHAIAGKMAGLNVVYIQILPPGLRLSGEPTGFWNAAISISGMLFSVLIGLAGALGVILLASRWPSIRYAVWLFVPMMAQALAWLCLPLVAVLGVRIPDGDIQKFMQQTNCPPLAISLIGLVLAALCAAVLKWVWS